MTDELTSWEEKATPEEIEWINALESGEYPKGAGTLRSSRDTYCCLGVRCELDERIISRTGRKQSSGYSLVSEEIYTYSMPTQAIRELWGMSGRVARELAEINDSSLTFEPVVYAIKEWIVTR